MFLYLYQSGILKHISLMRNLALVDFFRKSYMNNLEILVERTFKQRLKQHLGLCMSESKWSTSAHVHEI